MTEKPEVVEVIAKGKTGSGKSTILDKVAEILSNEGYFHIERREEPGQEVDVHQWERERDDDGNS
jgi:uridine kinase